MQLEENKIMYQDYICRFDLEQHMYIHRVRNDQIQQLKARFTEPDGSKLSFKILYDQDRSEVWTGSSAQKENRVKIEHVFDLDFNDLDKLKQKIRMYMLFS